jgi:hypothetical protein
MRKQVLLVLCVMALTMPCAASEPVTDPPTKITYALGGFMSGPFRLSVDLVTGEVEVAKAPPRNKRPPADLPVTQRFKASDGDLSQLRSLAVAVWAYGADDPGETIEHGAGQSIELKPCQASGDAMGNFEIERGAVKKSFDFSMPCLSAPANLLLDKLLCLPHPETPNCRTH